MNEYLPGELHQRITEVEAMEAAIQDAVNDALREHKRLGLPIVESREGRAVWIPADEIEIDNRPEGSPAKS